MVRRTIAANQANMKQKDINADSGEALWKSCMIEDSKQAVLALG